MAVGDLPAKGEYETYGGLPALAGIVSITDAMRLGLSIDACVDRLIRYHYAFRRLHEIFTARLTAEPIYELKTAFSLHAHLCAEHVASLRTRVGEMREPPLGLDVVPNANLQIFFDEILCAPDTKQLVAGLYEKALPALQASLERHLADTNWLVDYPSVRVCRFALLELGEMVEFGAQAVKCLVDDATRQAIEPWLADLDDALTAAGSLDGATKPNCHLSQRVHSHKPFRFDGRPQRDERFVDPYNRGVNPEAFLYDERYPNDAKTLMMFFKRLREIDVPEMMASIIHETKGKPWSYYRDMTRQLWDEARHAMMGEVGFTAAGVDWHRIPITWTWSLNLNTQLTPIERHAVLYFIEQGLMPRNGKRFEWEVATASGNSLAALFQDYDWADEVLHAKIGRKWYVKEYGSPKEALAHGDACWSKIASDFNELRKKGLTDHAPWWADVYRQACHFWRVDPNPEVLKFHETYERIRPDLKDISASG